MSETRHDDEQQETTGSGDPGQGFAQRPPRAEVEATEAERERRLAPENRPDNAEVDNTDATLPTVEEFAELNAGDAQEGSAGNADPAATFRKIQPAEEEVAEIEAERQRRLDPRNRPENTEVDNTGDNMPDVARD